MTNNKKANNIKKLRMQKEIYLLKDFAKIMGVSTTQASKWEHGTAIPSLKSINKLMEVLNVTYPELFDVNQPNLNEEPTN